MPTTDSSLYTLDSDLSPPFNVGLVQVVARSFAAAEFTCLIICNYKNSPGGAGCHHPVQTQVTDLSNFMLLSCSIFQRNHLSASQFNTLVPLSVNWKQ